MFRIRKILLRGNGVQDAYVDFDKGANILAGSPIPERATLSAV